MTWKHQRRLRADDGDDRLKTVVRGLRMEEIRYEERRAIRIRGARNSPVRRSQRWLAEQITARDKLFDLPAESQCSHDSVLLILSQTR